MKRVVTAFLPVLSVMALVAVGEVGVRLYHYARFDVPLLGAQPSRRMTSSRLSSITLDEELGWRATENYRFDGLKRSSDGSEYPARVSQDGNGFRMYGDLSAARPKVLVIGDSFTQAVEASDDRTYYAVLRDLLGVEMFAYGGGGYGTLQELLILDRCFDAIRPDLVLWQFSTNDVINNSPALEAASTVNNNRLTRPYWVDGRVQHILPSPDAGGIRRFAVNYCRVCYLLLHRIDKLQVAMRRTTVETETAPGEPQHGTFLAALQTTSELVGRLRSRVGSVPIVAFIVGAGTGEAPEYEAGLAAIASDHGIILLEGVTAAVADAARKGMVVTADDGVHWNEAGHDIAGRAIAAGLQRLPQIQARGDSGCC